MPAGGLTPRIFVRESIEYSGTDVRVLEYSGKPILGEAQPFTLRPPAPRRQFHVRPVPLPVAFKAGAGSAPPRGERRPAGR